MENVGVDAKRMRLLQARENLQVLIAISIIGENFLALIASGNDVIQSPWIFYPRPACHDAWVSSKET